MAPKEADLLKFLYGGRVNVSGIIELSEILEQGCDLGQTAGTETENGDSESFGDNVSLEMNPAASNDSDVQVLDLKIASPLVEAARLRRESYEKNRHFQDTWAARLPWAESVLGGDGRVCQESATKEKKKKGVQFRVVFSILSHGRPLTDYEDQRALLQQLRVPDMPKKHWSVSAS